VIVLNNGASTNGPSTNGLGQDANPDYSPLTPQPPTSPGAASRSPRSPIYVIASTDGTIWAAVSYLVENDALTFITTRNERKQIPLKQLDRKLTEDLNAQAGISLRLP